MWRGVSIKIKIKITVFHFGSPFPHAVLMAELRIQSAEAFAPNGDPGQLLAATCNPPPPVGGESSHSCFSTIFIFLSIFMFQFSGQSFKSDPNVS